VFHEDYLVSLGVVGKELEGIVEQRPLLFIEDLFSDLCLYCHLFLFLLLALFLLLLFALCANQDQGLHHSPIHYILIDVEIVAALGVSALLFFLLGTTQVEKDLQGPFIFLADLAQLVVEDNEVILEAIDCLQLHLHAVPG
jgi:hypothetical protein